MATKTTVQSGNYSNPATWGGSLPADNDTIVIAAGHELVWDVDLTSPPYSWTTGVAGLTITGHASGTPGRLTCPTSAGTYVVPIKSGSILVGTDVTNKGQLYIGSAGTPLPATARFEIRSLGGNSTLIDATYLDVQIYCTHPANILTRLTAAGNVSDTVLQVSPSVLGDWVAGDLVYVCDSNGQDAQAHVIQSVGDGTITLTSGLTAAKIVGARVFKTNRNVEVTYGGTGTAVYRGATNTYWRLAIRQRGAVQGYGFRWADVVGGTFDGVLSGFSSGLVSGGDTVMSGVLVGCTNAWSQSGTHGSHVISGWISGCTNALLGQASPVVSGELSGCVTAIAGCTGYLITSTGRIVGNSYGMAYSNGRILEGATIGGSAAPDLNGVCDIRTLHGGRSVGYGAGLRSTTQVVDTNKGVSRPDNLIALFDVANGSGTPQPGKLKWWSSGGYGASEDWSQPTHGDPPVPLAFVHTATFQSASYDNIIEIPLWGQAGIPLVVRVYCRKQQTGMTVSPYAKLIDPNKEFGAANEALASATMADNTDWQTLSLSYTPAHDRPLVLRVGGRNATGTMYWNWDILPVGRRPQMRLAGV